jgi:uncharacterized coiled-coil protein SlyX
VKQQLRELADDVVAGRTDRGDAAVVSQVLNVYLRAVSVEIKVKEQDEILQRINSLESASGQGRWAGADMGINERLQRLEARIAPPHEVPRGWTCF